MPALDQNLYQNLVFKTDDALRKAGVQINKNIRHRSRGEGIIERPVGTYYEYDRRHNIVGTLGKYPESASQFMDIGSFEECDDVVTPGFNAIEQKTPGLINNPFYKRQVTRNLIELHSRTNEVWSGSDHILSAYIDNAVILPGLVLNDFPGVTYPVVDMPVMSPANVINDCLADAAQVDWLSLVDLVESKKTIESLHQSADLIIKLIKSEGKGKLIRFGKGDLVLKYSFPKRKWQSLGDNRSREGIPARPPGSFKFNFPYVARLQKELADTYLLDQFGIMNILYSMEGALQSLVEISRPPAMTFRRATRYLHEGRKSTVLPTVWWGPEMGNTTWTTRSERTVNYRVGVVAHTNLDIISRSGFTTGSFAATAYELIPYSWLLDYVIKIGSAIEALRMQSSPFVKASWVTARVTYFNEYTFNVDSAFHDFGGWALEFKQGSPFNMTESIVLQQRSPSIHAGLPTLDTSFKSITHGLNGAAAAYQKLYNLFTPHKGRRK